MASAMRVAKYLAEHQYIERVIYPPLESHPQHELYKKQMSGFSGMMSIYLKGDEVEKSKRFLKHLKVSRTVDRDHLDVLFLFRSQLFTLAESLGGYESLIELPAVMTHASVPEGSSPSIGHHRWSHSHISRTRRRARSN